MSKLSLQYVSKYEYNDTSYIGILLKLPIQLAQVNMISFFTAYVVNFVMFSLSKPLKNSGSIHYSTKVDVLRKEWIVYT